MPNAHNEKMQQLLLKLHEEMQNADVDAETQGLMRKFDAEIQALIGPDDSSTTVESALDHAKSLQADFSVSHPAANGFVTEVISTLVKMGV
jgi:hypothetical protein